MLGVDCRSPGSFLYTLFDLGREGGSAIAEFPFGANLATEDDIPEVGANTIGYKRPHSALNVFQEVNRMHRIGVLCSAVLSSTGYIHIGLIPNAGSWACHIFQPWQGFGLLVSIAPI